ncbi:MAG TPA: carboxymuconolactone decarboxylase family protein [Burkholderiales bacterium]|jgi:uncharacterized peroxidase-related enzyme|nr:carboxymuconolactone decarboxylase family protein [Burkholderiales bacterium]
MARVSHMSSEKVDPELRPLYAEFAAEQFGNQVAVLAHSAPVLRHLYGMVKDLREEGELPQRLVEIAVVATSEANRCKYCVAHHAPVLKGLGLPAETVARILEPEVPGLDERERLVRDYAVLVTEQPGRIRDGVFERLRGHFSERQIVELTARIALCGVFNRLNDALQIESEL